MVLHCGQVPLRNPPFIELPRKGVGNAVRRQRVKGPAMPSHDDNKNDDGKFQLRTN